METAEELPPFPYEVIWDDFDPSVEVTWEMVEARRERIELMFHVLRLSKTSIPRVTKRALRKLALAALGRPPRPSLTEKLYLLAGWRLADPAGQRFGTDLRRQRAALKRLEAAAAEFWQASLQVSGHVALLLRWLQPYEPERLMLEGSELDIHSVGVAAYDVSLVARRIYQETAPKKTGRSAEFRRDATVCLAAHAIERETGERIRTSRGTKANAQPHFANGGGLLLRGFFNLVEPRTHERLLVQSLARVRKKAELRKNSKKRA